MFKVSDHEFTEFTVESDEAFDKHLHRLYDFVKNSKIKIKTREEINSLLRQYKLWYGNPII